MPHPHGIKTMKTVTTFILTTVLCACSVPAIAGGRNNNAMKQHWTNPTMSHCLTHDIGDACVGGSLSGCKNWINPQNNDNVGANRGTAQDEGAILMLVARDVNENGAKFCVTQLQGANKNKKNAWTVYYNPAGNITNCFWLCKAGFSGEGCSAGVATGCDSVPIRRSDFDKYKIATSGPSVEGEIFMFHWDENKSCGVHKKQEHDMILAISEFLPSGHGAYARPMVFRAERAGWKHMVSTATLWWAGDKTLLCKDGYQPNPGKTDCVAINQNTCNMNSMCTGWNPTDFNESAHTMHANGSCYEFRCMTPGTAFTSSTNRTCIECTGDNRVGIPSATGVCVRCPTGKIFDDNASASSYCRDAAQYNTQTMAYGKGRTRNADLKDQCWTMLESDEYKACVTGVPTSAE